MKRRLYLFLLWMIAALIFPLLPAGQGIAGESVSVTDMVGRTVVVPENAARIIAVGPGALRLLCYLDAKDKVVGIEGFEKIRPTGRPYWIAGPELKNLPVIGPGGPSRSTRSPIWRRS